jgi:short-subunit dehydrogenase
MLAVFLQGLRSRLHASGVSVITLKTGPMVTPTAEDPDRRGLLWARPDRVARGIVRAFERRRDVVYLPWFWRPVQWAMHVIPEPVLKRLSP